MFNENLFKQVLLDPLREGADSLLILSGYATSAMAFHHLQQASEINNEFTVKLLVGMCPLDGVSMGNHKAFQKLANEDYSKRFICNYVYKNHPVHSKLYIWNKKKKPYRAFLGSANYTQTAFILKKQRELLSECDPKESLYNFNLIEKDSIICSHEETESLVQIFKDKNINIRRRMKESEESDKNIPSTDGLEMITTSFLEKDGTLPPRSGLNWGQRPKREPNQAYIRLESKVYNSNFFPEKSIHFTVLTDDSKTLICTRAQANGKAIEAPHNNSLIGEYFRNRLGLANGAFVEKSDLIRYGRTDVTFYKIDDENYYMDFSK